MLVFGRKVGESVVVLLGNAEVVVKVVEITRNSVRLATEAPQEIPVHRGEIHAQLKRENRRTVRRRRLALA